MRNGEAKGKDVPQEAFLLSMYEVPQKKLEEENIPGREQGPEEGGGARSSKNLAA
jgi:hypothetical protein